VTGNRVVVLGRGGAGKSTVARQLAETTGLPLVELDKVFWRPDLTPTPRAEWIDEQRRLIAEDRWIMDGDLGPYDAPEVRLNEADTVIVLDFSLARCAWRALRRSRERWDFWRWVITYRRHVPQLMAAVDASNAAVHVFRSPRALARFLGT
jgi:adenylate kinase family enzyme